ncbi:uncharacterized protein LOC111339808 [Stylophora pistillata]|uniref:uncharacterized protein LOC111339808 n=1 Tax=Stylophora pistillata TaxID=50429 RepID=UPI000C04518D|nr:uncharacterized protein LOC111339808 [Stylophora pistillata]
MPRGKISDLDFKSSISKVYTTFQALGLGSLASKIQTVEHQTGFPTKELNAVSKKVDDLEQELRETKTQLQEKENNLQQKGRELQDKEEQRQVLENQFNTDVSPFCILPSKPTHDVEPRRKEVAEITQQLKALKSENNDGLSTLHISGNPGSGKSQLARLAAERFYDEVQHSSSATSFVMTLNAENSQTLLESYVSFARHCNCPEYTETNTFGSKNLSTDEKIASLKTLISIKVNLYSSWLLVVDNVLSLSQIDFDLREFKDKN